MTFSADRHVDFYIGPQSSNGFNNGIISFQAEGGISYYQLQNNQPILLWTIDSVDNPNTSYIPY